MNRNYDEIRKKKPFYYRVRFGEQCQIKDLLSNMYLLLNDAVTLGRGILFYKFARLTAPAQICPAAKPKKSCMFMLFLCAGKICRFYFSKNTQTHPSYCGKLTKNTLNHNDNRKSLKALEFFFHPRI